MANLYELATELGHPAAAVAERARSLGIDTAWAGAPLAPQDGARLRADLAADPPDGPPVAPGYGPAVARPRPTDGPGNAPWAGTAEPGAVPVPPAPIGGSPGVPSWMAGPRPGPNRHMKSGSSLPRRILRPIRFVLENWFIFVFWGLVVLAIIGVTWFGHAIQG